MFFLPNTDSFRRPGWFCWPIGVAAALVGRLQPSESPKPVKKTRKFRPKSGPDRRIFDFFGFQYLYGDIHFCSRQQLKKSTLVIRGDVNSSI